MADGAEKEAGKRSISRLAVRGSIIAGLVAFLIDRGQKFVQLELLGWRDICPPPATAPYCPYHPVAPFFDYVLVWNTGISYGLLRGVPLVGLLALMILAVLMLIWWWFKADTMLTRYGLAIAIGGAASHIIDRLVYGAVPDFFLLHWRSWSFYVFNLSDMAITIGVFLLLLDMVLPKSRPPA